MAGIEAQKQIRDNALVVTPPLPISGFVSHAAVFGPNYCQYLCRFQELQDFLQDLKSWEHSIKHKDQQVKSQAGRDKASSSDSLWMCLRNRRRIAVSCKLDDNMMVSCRMWLQSGVRRRMPQGPPASSKYFPRQITVAARWTKPTHKWALRSRTKPSQLPNSVTIISGISGINSTW